MAGLGTAATTLITTRGLWIDDGITSALEFGAGITPWFRLWISELPPVNNYVAAAGSYPLMPGQIQTLYRELPPQQQFYVIPRDQEAKYFQRNKIITVKFSIAGKDVEKIFAVNETRARMAFKVINLMNDTKARIHVYIKNVKHVASTAMFRIRNLRLARKGDK